MAVLYFEWSWAVAPIQGLYVIYQFNTMYINATNNQIVIHLGTYVTWVTTMARLRQLTQPSDYLTEALVETISVDKGLCKGNIYASIWYIGLLVLYVTHAIHVFWTFTYKRHKVPDVKNYHSLPPRVAFV
jgi:aspartate ammonia-lyase